MRFSFEDFVVDTERYVIERGGRPVDVQRQVFDVLAYLLEHRDRVVPKEELLDEIWGDRFISESALTSRIKSARQLVGDDGVAQAYIKTTHGRGYRWVADVTVAPPSDESGPGLGTQLLIAPPVPLTTLVGRDAEKEAVMASVEHRRLTTAVGPPGVGKSRLVTEVARVLADGGRPVAFVDLRLADSGDDVAQLVQRAIGGTGVTSPHDLRARAGGDGDVSDHLVAQLRSSALLLVLDNCEHVADAAGALSFRLLTRCPDLAVVTTSRRRLGVVGEAVVLVEPLTTPGEANTSWELVLATDAGRLFVDRSIAAGARWNGSADEATLVAQVCRRLDGLPLAIELAAARTQWLSLPDLVRHLDRELGPDGSEPLTAALQMSRALLSAADARAFDSLSVFAGSFTIDAGLAVIEAVNPPYDALTTFERLVDHSLISVSDGQPRRYRLLETIQRYADVCRLGSDAPMAATGAHAHFYLDFVEQRWPSGRIVTDTPWEVLDAEMTEVLAAIDRAVDDDPAIARRLVGAVGWFWSIAGYAEQCVSYAERLSDGDGHDLPGVHAAVLWSHASCLQLLGRDPVETATRAHAVAVEAGSWSVAAWSLAHMIAPDTMWADLDAVESRWDEVVGLFRRGDDPLGEAWAMVFVLGWAEACAQLHPRATRTYQEAAAVLERHGDSIGAARALLEVVELNIWSGDDPDVARSVLERVPIFDDASLEFRMKRLWLEGQLASAEADWGRAIECHTVVLELVEQSMPESILANTYRCLFGCTLRRAGHSDAAAARFEQALTRLPSAGAPRGLAGHSTWVLESVAGFLSDVGAVDTAARVMAAAHRARLEFAAPMPYWDRPRYEPDLQQIRDQLGDDDFDTTWSDGLELDLPSAIALARAALADLSASPQG